MTLSCLFLPWDPQPLQHKGKRKMTNRPSSTPPTCIPSAGVFQGLVRELAEPKKRTEYAPPLCLHWRCSSLTLWGWCVNCGARSPPRFPKKGAQQGGCATIRLLRRILRRVLERGVLGRRLAMGFR